jgi:hypothetical protein
MLSAWNAAVAGAGLGNRFRSAVISSALEGDEFIYWIGKRSQKWAGIWRYVEDDTSTNGFKREQHCRSRVSWKIAAIRYFLAPFSFSIRHGCR